MATVDWKAISPLIEVIYSSLDDPHSCDEFSGDVAAIRFLSEYGVDVEWRHADSMFLVRLFCGSFDTSIVEERVASAKDVVDLVQTWLDRGKNPELPQIKEIYFA